jgi:GNAT superfamily N-acetyltransferase
MTEETVIELITDRDDILACYPVMVLLRPRLSAEAFCEQVLRQFAQGYQLAALKANGKVQAVAGFRLQEMLSRGKFLYVDDLVTDEAARSHGYGKALLDWLFEYARAAGCRRVDLDSGVQRAGAHRFYFREGMTINAFHFTAPVREG